MLICRQGRIPHDAFDGEAKRPVVLGDEHPVIEDDEGDLDPGYTGPEIREQTP